MRGHRAAITLREKAFYNERMEIREQRASRPPRDVFELIGRREQIDRMAHAMRAIAHPLRLKILCVLGEQESSVQDA